MEWLPGTSIFRHHTPVLWLSVLTGGLLGMVAGRIRSIGTAYEGRPWMLGLSALAGTVLGVTIFLVTSMVSLLSNARSGGGGALPVAVLTMLAQLVAFAVVTLRWRRL